MEENTLFDWMRRLADESFVLSLFRFSQGQFANCYSFNLTFQDLYGINFNKHTIMPVEFFSEESLIEVISDSYDELRFKIDKRHTKDINTCSHKEVEVAGMKVCKLCLKDPVKISNEELYKKEMHGRRN